MSESTITDLTNTIKTQATQVQSTSVDGMAVTNRSLSELIAAQKYLDSKENSTKPLRALRFFKIRSRN